MTMAKRTVRAGVRRGLAIGPLRRLVEGELQRRGTPSAPATGPSGVFVDRNGVAHQLDPALRDRLKPNWRTMSGTVQPDTPPSVETLQARVRKATKSVAELERVLTGTTGTAVTGRILEVGCYDGSAAFELSKRAGTTVIASDLARYYATQRPGASEAAAIAAEEASLANLREAARQAAGRPEGSVTFVEDDITTSTLEPGTFDIIVSFEVLEHVADPPGAFAAMARLLRPGGLAYHDYNPFFSQIGGHSLVTLDFPWGHARLDAQDVERYLREVRPAEAEQDLRFYRESLNRMTQADLRDAVAGAGLELVAMIPWYQRSLLPEAGPEVLAEVRATYPRATLEDLLATFIAVVVRKPAGPGKP